MPTWTNIDIKSPNDLKQFNIELNRRIRYYLSNIDVSQILFNLNDIDGTLLLSKGGTGASLTAPTSDNIMFYDVSESKVDWLSVGSGLAISGTTIYNTIFGVGSTAAFYKITASTANLADISSTNSATFNALASSSATIGQLGSTGSITANTMTASSGTFSKVATSSATIGQLGSTGSATFNTIVSSSATFTKLSASSAKFGNSTSYSMFEDDGTYVAMGDAITYRDELGDITKLKVVGMAITDDSTDCTVNYSTQSALTSYQYTNVQLNHDRKLSAGLYPHLHWLQSSGNAPNLLLAYRYLPNCSTAPVADWAYLKCNTLACSYASGTVHQVSYSTQAITPPVNSTVSDIVQFRIFRDVANASTVFSSTDDYSLPVKLLSFDVHIETDTLGSRTEYSK